MLHAVQGFQIHFEVGAQQAGRTEQIEVIEVHGKTAALVHIQGGGQLVDDVNDARDEHALGGKVVGQHFVTGLMQVFESAVVEHEQKLPLVGGGHIGLKIGLRRFVHSLILKPLGATVGGC